MARSEAATERRALKRKRSLENQKKIDDEAEARQQAKKRELQAAEIIGGAAELSSFVNKGICKEDAPEAARAKSTKKSNSISLPSPFSKRVVEKAAKQLPHAAPDTDTGEDADANAKDWTCSSCGNVNWARRTVCNSKTCQARAAEKTAWAPQSDAERIKENMELRKKFAENPGLVPCYVHIRLRELLDAKYYIATKDVSSHLGQLTYIPL
jgi:hypothetical protein